MPRQQCAFVQYTTRAAAEAAAEKSFNKLIVNGQRLNIKWGKSQGLQQTTVDHKDALDGRYLEPVPGLPGGKNFTMLPPIVTCRMYAVISCMMNS